MSNKHMHWITPWLKMSQKQVLDKFASIPGAFSDGKRQERFVYIEGARRDKVLLVAHADTVWAAWDQPEGTYVKVLEHDGILFSGNQDLILKYKDLNTNKKYKITGMGICADDRAGCGLIWNLRDLGHSILITSGEEIGCVATKKLMKHEYWKNKINDHQFAVQFDRRNARDIVTYDVGTPTFIKYVEQETGYKHQQGSTTDIVHLCKDMCGVNISVGYYFEHTKDEKLVLDQFENTLRISRAWLSKTDIPKFTLVKEKPKQYPPLQTYNVFDNSRQHLGTTRIKHSKKKGSDPAIEDYSFNIPENLTVGCQKCYSTMNQEEWLENKFVCKRCHNFI